MYLKKINSLASLPLKLVYELKKDLVNKPDYVADVQQVTLDIYKKDIGLKGNNGLYGSKEWWENIDNGVIPIKSSFGTITRVYEAGQDHMGRVNSFDYKTPDGIILSEGIYVLNKKDINLFKEGKLVAIAYCLDELKSGSPNYIKAVLEMAISE